jgi:hypothetical protein
MSEFTPIHMQIASDKYWDTPRAPEVKVPFGKSVYDVLCAPAVSSQIDQLFQRLDEQGTLVTPLPEGEELAVDVPGGLLKVVEDMRTHPKRRTQDRQYDTPALFDTQAQAMVDEVLFNGHETGTQVEGINGTVDVARRTVYLVNSPSVEQLAGKTSELLGRGGGRHSIEFWGRTPIGHTTVFETRKDSVETRVVSAAILRPRGTRRVHRRIIDLGEIGAKLVPTPQIGFS